jgi:hypothetical protein
MLAERPKRQGTVKAEDGYVVCAGRGDRNRASEVKTAVVKGPCQSNRIAVCRRDDVSAWRQILRKKEM